MLALTACPADEGDGGDGGDAGGPVRKGGSVRVGVWAAPDVAAPHLGGAAVRALVLPQLFVAGPDGQWEPSIVEPGSDDDGDGGRTARFALRASAKWSNGQPITADDLRRTRDPSAVDAVEGPDGDGRITLRFPRPTPNWRRLWSGTDSIAAPADGVWGGPFTVASTVPGLETVLTRNDTWGGPAPAHLDEVRLVHVPDSTMARQLLARGELDVVMPPAYLHRAPQLRTVAGVEVATAEASGWWVGLFLSSRLDERVRRSALGAVDRDTFVATLLAGEGAVLDGFTDEEARPWAEVGNPSLAGLRGETIDMVTVVEEPMSGVLHRSMQRRVRETGGRFENRSAEYDRAAGWIANGEYEAAVTPVYDGPVPCWTCRWGTVDGNLAAAADGGDADAAVQLETKLRDQALLLPLWRSAAVTAWRPAAVRGVEANGFGLSAAWNAWEWSKPA